MKRLLDRYQGRLRQDELRALHQGLRRKLQSSPARREATLRRWSVSFAVAAGLVVATGILLTRLDLGGDSLRLPRWRLLGPPNRVVDPRSAQLAPAAPDDQPARSDRIAESPGAPGGNPFTAAAEDSVSMFSLDLTTASYLEARGVLASGALPAASGIRVDEFVDFFEQEYPEFREPEVRVFLEGAPSPFTEGAELLRVGVRAREAGEGAGPIVAAGARIEVLFHPGVVERYRLLGFENRAAPGRAPGEPVAGTDLRAGQEATALYEVKLRGPLIPGKVATATVRYSRAGEEGDRAVAGEGAGGAERADRGDARRAGAPLLTAEQSLEVSDFADTFDAASPRFRLDAVAARFAEILRYGHGWTGDRLALLLPVARRLSAELRDPSVTELADLIARAEQIADRMVIRP
jgi:hypothetical protein